MSKSPLKKYFEKSALKRTYDPKTGMWSDADKMMLSGHHSNLIDEGIQPGSPEYEQSMNDRKQAMLTADTAKTYREGGREIVEPGHTLKDVKDDYEPKYRY